MKNIFIVLLAVLPFYMSAQTATIKIDIDRIIGGIDPKIYGVFMEPIEFRGRPPGSPDAISFNTLYGNLYDPSSPLADENGFRKDYIEAMKELKITNMRWPGGNYVAGYNWQDGIGPKEQRPVRKDLAWGGIDNNHVGTDEWVQLNRSIGSENVVCINLGLGTINDARYWVEYCNLDHGTYYSDLRAKYGNRKPFNVTYWCLGNEVDGSPWIMGHKNAEDYCKIAIEAAKAMRATDNTIKFISNGSSYYESSGKWIDWNWKVITELRGIADYISIHRYWDRADNYYDFVGQSSFDIEEKIIVVHSQIEVARAMYPAMKSVYLSVDEWAPFGQNLLSTLAVAMYLNSFIRHADIVKMANFTMLTSLLGNDREKGTFKTPLFHTFKLFSNNCLGNSVDTYVGCDTFNTEKYKGIPYLDVTTVYSEETNTVYINVVNRHKDHTITTDIITSSGEFTGKAEANIITGDSLTDPFTYDRQDQYNPVAKEIKAEKNSISCSFPAHSFTQIKIGIKK
ncbi:MAG: alpha-N-arabinofuranosidase [Bacteroides sp. SM23_62_1]|nr:MAG: alpha-N-arabinofuranosidase [Bacteroides sp. SM23_62_1]